MSQTDVVWKGNLFHRPVYHTSYGQHKSLTASARLHKAKKIHTASELVKLSHMIRGLPEWPKSPISLRDHVRHMLWVRMNGILSVIPMEMTTNVVQLTENELCCFAYSSTVLKPPQRQDLRTDR